MTEEVAKRTTRVRKDIRNYREWCKKNQEGYLEDPLELPDCRKPEVWTRCVEEGLELPRDATPFDAAAMDDTYDDALTEEESLRHTAILSDMTRTSTSLSSMKKLMDEHASTSDTMPAPEALSSSKKRKKRLKLAQRISVAVAPRDACGSDYSSDEEEEAAAAAEVDVSLVQSTKRLSREDEDEEARPPKRRKIDSIVDELSQTPQEREREFVSRTKGVEAVRGLQERQSSVLDALEEEEGKRKPVKRSRETSVKTGFHGADLKRSAGPQPHPYSQFHRGEHQALSELRDSRHQEDPLIDDMDVEVSEKEYEQFVKSVLVTLHSESDPEGQLKTNSYYATKVYGRRQWTEPVKNIHKVVEKFLLPLKRDILEFINLMGSLYGDGAKDVFLGVSCPGITHINATSESITNRDQYEEITSKACCITDMRLQDTGKTNTKRFLTMKTAKYPDIVIGADHIPVATSIHLIHSRIAPLISMVYSASHYYQELRGAFRAYIKKSGENKLPASYTVKDMFLAVCSADPDSVYMAKKKQYVDLRQGLQQCTAALQPYAT